MQIRRFARFANFHVFFPVTSHLSSFPSTSLPPIPVSPPVPNYLLPSYSTYLRPSISNRPLPIFLHLPLRCSPPLIPSCLVPLLFYTTPVPHPLSFPPLSSPFPFHSPCPALSVSLHLQCTSPHTAHLFFIHL